MPDPLPVSLPQGPLSPGTVHLCVDMQRLFGEGSPWNTPWLPRVTPVVERLVAAHPQHTIFTRFIPPANPQQAIGRWRAYYQRWRAITGERLESRFLELVPELARYAPPAMVIDKTGYSPFHGTRLAEELARRGTDSLVISGTETDVCVLAAALDAVDRGLRVLLVQDGLCSSSDEMHDSMLRYYHRRLAQQVEIADAEVILRHWPSHGGGGIAGREPAKNRQGGH